MYLAKSSQNLLEVALEYGHATIHRGYRPTEEEINGVLDIIENLLHTEALTSTTEDLKKSAPKNNEKISIYKFSEDSENIRENF